MIVKKHLCELHVLMLIFALTVLFDIDKCTEEIYATPKDNRALWTTEGC